MCAATSPSGNPHVSKQLAISASLSAFAMVAFVLFAVPQAGTQTATGAKAEAFAPADAGQSVAALPLIGN